MENLHQVAEPGLEFSKMLKLLSFVKLLASLTLLTLNLALIFFKNPGSSLIVIEDCCGTALFLLELKILALCSLLVQCVHVHCPVKPHLVIQV